MLTRWRTRIAMIAWLVLFLVSLLTTGLSYIAPLSFVVVVMIAWDHGYRPALAWIGAIHILIPAVLVLFEIGPFFVFTQARELVAAIMAMTIVAMIGLAYLTDRVHALTMELQASQAALQDAVAKLQVALTEVKELQGLLPICSWCKQIRKEDGTWEVLETYIHDHTRATLTHGVCPRCLAEQMASIRA